MKQLLAIAPLPLLLVSATALAEGTVTKGGGSQSVHPTGRARIVRTTEPRAALPGVTRRFTTPTMSGGSQSAHRITIRR
jgi:hypothetical protein